MNKPGNIAKSIALIGALTYILVELTGFVLIRYKYIDATLPDFDFSYTLKKYPFQIADIDSIWGTWHYKEPFRYSKDCMVFDYTINSYGARDKERVGNSNDTGRVLVLGDSFIEGYGVTENDRLTNILENSTHREFLNFGCSDFGTTQEYALYKYFEKKFSHSVVMLFVLPFNDFKDNDTAFYDGNYYKRYRPFFVGSYPNFRMIYKQQSLKSSNFNKEGFFDKENSLKGKIGRFLRANTFWFNILQFTLRSGSYKRGYAYSGYYDFDKADIEKLFYILGKTRELAANRRFIVVSLPVAEDIKRYNKAGVAPFTDLMKTFCSNNNIEYMDLLPSFAELYIKGNSLYLECNAHWNAEGNRAGATALLSLFK